MGEGERQRAGGRGSAGEGERQRAGGRGSAGEGERQRAGGRGSAGGWVVLTALPHTSAVLLRGALRAEGVAAELERDGLAAVYGLDGAGLSTRVVVPVGAAERARRILDELESSV